MISEQVNGISVRRWIVLWVGLGLGFAYLGFAYLLFQVGIPESHPLEMITRSWSLNFAVVLTVTAMIVLGLVREKVNERGLSVLIVNLLGLLIIMSCGVFFSMLFLPNFNP